MNEDQKNIETCLAENILAEVASVPQDPQFRSLVNESLDPSRLQAAAQTGWDAYEKVVWTHWPYTFTSSVRQMKSNLILLLRRLWRFPFGRGTIRSFADMWQHYITRLSGNPEYGIPSRLSSLTDLPDAPLLLSDRKIGGVPEAEDGMSMAHLLHDTSAITELTDDNKWVLTKNNYVSTLASLFPAVTKMTLGITKSDGLTIANGSLSGILDLVIPYLSEIITTASAPYGWRLFAGLGISKLHIPSLTYFYGRGSNSSNDGYIYNMANLTEIEFGTKGVPFEFNMRSGNHNTFICGDGDSLPNLTTVKIWCNKFNLVSGSWRPFISQCNSITTLVFDTLHEQLGYQFGGSANLIHLEFGEGTDCSIEFTRNWSPTNALDASRTDLIEEGSTAQNNLQQFLQNFKTYIAERLTDNGSGKTLTLSQAVRNAIHAAESTYGIENIIITQKGWTISPAPN